MSPEPGSLNPSQRRRDLARMAEQELDILVIGGGVTGVGCALDAISRGLTVGLVEQRDLASGTSSRSSKLMHGGLRYLEQKDFALVHEALQERGLHTTSIAPHLVRPVSFLIPLTGRIWQRAYYGAGVLLYDLMALARGKKFPRHRHLSRKQALALVPGLQPSSLIGGILYFDAQIDDARHTIAVARTAAEHGAAIATSTRVESLLKNADRVVGARVRDIESDDDYEIRAKRTINATGVWIDDIQDMAGPTGLRVHAAKGVHVVVPRDRIEGESGVVLRTPTSVLFIIPWGDYWLLGTTDTSWTLDRAHPAASSKDIDYLLEQANAALRQPLTRDDIVGVYAGLRPLIAGEGDETARFSREHAVAQPTPGLISIAGGKYTTYRVMAQDAVDMAVEDLPSAVPESSTDELPLIGADAWEQTWKDAGPDLATDYRLPLHLIERLLWRHGSRTTAVLALTRHDPELAEILPGGGYLAAEAIYAVRHEGALHLEDVLARRMRISIETTDRGVDIAERVADLLAPELGWNHDDRAEQVQAWIDRVDAELAANDALDDRTADIERRRAIDGRGLLDTNA
ncbi:MAG: glycerol-3-phosphate dehydrogenase/oxidase [Acidimicrobiales bacterium]